MIGKPALASGLLLLAFTLGSHSARAEEAWKWSLAPYLWLISLDGKQKTHDSGSEIDRPIKIDMGAAIKGFEYGMLGHLEARKSKWGWFVDAAYVALELEANVGPVKFDDIGFDGLEVELAGVYQPWGVNSDWDFFAGLRYWDLSAEIPITSSLRVVEDVSWTDIMAGARYGSRLSEKWRFQLRGDLAGANSGSDLTLNLDALVGMNVFKTGVLLFGWRYMDVKFTEGNADDLSDDNYYELDVIFSGPVVSYQFNW